MDLIFKVLCDLKFVNVLTSSYLLVRTYFNVKDFKTMQTNQTSKHFTNLSNLPPLVRPKQVCSLLSISKTTLYKLINKGNLKLVKINERASAIPSESIEKYLKQINAVGL